MGMDCSGFTQVVLSLFGKHLLRNASEQATQGTEVPSLDQAQAGDLAFFCKYPAGETPASPMGNVPSMVRPGDRTSLTAKKIEEPRPLPPSPQAGRGSSPASPMGNAPVTHVGILIDKQRIIHCSGRVKVEKIDATGIFSIEQADAQHPQGQYTHQLLSIRRY